MSTLKQNKKDFNVIQIQIIVLQVNGYQSINFFFNEQNAKLFINKKIIIKTIIHRFVV